MNVALLLAGCSFLLLVVFGRIFALEHHRGRRFFLASFRNFLDSALHQAHASLHARLVYFGKYIVTLSWYYSLHAFLMVVLRCIAGVYYAIESILHRNRDKARKVRRDKKNAQQSHLDVLVDHQSENKLTEGQKKRLKEKAISGK